MKEQFLNLSNTFNQNILLAIGILFTFLTPIHDMLVTTGLFVIIDTIFAIYAAVKLGGWSEFKSHKLWNFCPKTFFYLGAIILGFLVDKFIVQSDIWGIKLLITKLICFMFIYIEIKSLDETSMKLGNKSFWVIIKEMMNKAKSIKKDISGIVDKEEDKEE